MSFFTSAAQFISGALLAGGKAGDPLGQQTYAAHGEEGARIQLQSQQGLLGAPRGPGGYHERTGADIAKRVEGTWHDYGLGMTVPIGLLASQVASEAGKSLFREDQTFGEAIRDPLGIVTAFKDTAANIQGLREGGYKTTYDYLTDFGGGISNFFSSFATGGTFTGGATGGAIGGASLPITGGIEALPVVSSIATLAKRLMNIEEILAKQNQLLAIIQKAFSGMATIAGPAEEEETEERLTEKKAKAQGMGFKKRFKKLTKQTAIWGSLLYLLASWIQGGKDVENKDWLTKMGGSLLHWLTGGAVGFEDRPEEVINLPQTDDDVEERAGGGQTRTYAIGGTFTPTWQNPNVKAHGYASTPVGSTFTPTWQNPNATATSSGYSPAPLEEKKEGGLSKVIGGGLSRVLAHSPLKPMSTLANLAVMAEQRGWVGEGFVKVGSSHLQRDRTLEEGSGEFDPRPGAGESYLRGGKVIPYRPVDDAGDGWQNPNKKDGWMNPNIKQFAGGGYYSGGAIEAPREGGLYGSREGRGPGIPSPKGIGGKMDLAPKGIGGKMDLAPKGIGGVMDLTPKGIGGKMDLAPKGIGGKMDLAPKGIGGKMDLAPKGIGGKMDLTPKEPKLLDAYGSPMVLGGKKHSDPAWNRLAAHPDRRGTTHTSRRDSSKFHNNMMADKKFYKKPPILKMMDQLEGPDLDHFIETNFDQIEEAQGFYRNVNMRDPFGDVIAPRGVKHDAYMGAMKPDTGQYWKKAGVFDDQLPTGMTEKGLGTRLGSWLNPNYVEPKVDIWGSDTTTNIRPGNVPTSVPPEQIQVGSDAIKGIATTVVVDALGSKIVSEAETTYNYIVDVPFTGATQRIYNYGTLTKDGSEGVPNVPGLR